MMTLSKLVYFIGWMIILAAFIFGFIMVSVRTYDPNTKMSYDIFGYPAGDDFDLIPLLFSVHGWIELVGFWGGIGLGYGVILLSEKIVKA